MFGRIAIVVALTLVPTMALAQASSTPPSPPPKLAHVYTHVDQTAFAADRIASLLNTYDLNRDGVITTEELNAKVAEQFDLLDHDHDGNVQVLDRHQNLRQDGRRRGNLPPVQQQ